MLWLRSVHIRKFRAMAPETSLHFGRGPVFLLGRNGSGKSTLLELLGRLAAVNVVALEREDEELDLTWEVAWDVGESATYALESSFKVSEETPPLPKLGSASRKHWQWEGRIYRERRGREGDGDRQEVLLFKAGSRFWSMEGKVPRSVLIEPSDFAPLLGTQEPTPAALAKSFVPLLSRLTHEVGGEVGARHDQTKQALARLGELMREAGQVLDEALDTFRRVFVVGDAPRDAVRTIGIPVGDSAERTEFQTLFVPLHRLDQSLFEGAPDSGQITIDSGVVEAPSEGDAPLVELLRDELGARRVELSTRMVEKDRHGRRHWHRFTLDVYWPPDDTMHNHDRLSFGQKRLVAFLWYQAVMDERPLFCDELTNGMHATWVGRILDLLEGRQVFHAVQNPLLLDRTGLGETADISGQFVFCDVHGEEHRYWRWRNPDEDQAARLDEAWDAGYESLSELLLHLGLW